MSTGWSIGEKDVTVDEVARRRSPRRVGLTDWPVLRKNWVFKKKQEDK